MTRLLALIAVLAAGCGGAHDAVESSASDLPAADPGPVHVHGLGVDARDGSLDLAAHTGLYVIRNGERVARRVGDSHQDTMGFAVAADGRFVGSGHPDPRSDLPPHLGLIESTDGGRTWRSISLLGEADFHVLRLAGRTLYGFDASHGRLLASEDGGRTWDERSPPEPLVDLVPHPRQPQHLVAAGSALHRSRDGGRSWEPLGGEPGLLAWPTPDRLLHVSGGGRVRASSDGGKRWRRLGAVGGTPAAFLAVDADELYVALHDGTVVVSANGGRSWSVRSRP